MNNPRVCILTAGKGSRLNDRTRYFNKALLRVGDKAVISHQIDMFGSDTTFVIGLGYMGDVVKQYLEIAHPDTHFIFVEIDKFSVPGAGPGYAMMKCKEHLQQPFFFLACDTLIENPDDDYDLTKEQFNWVGVSMIRKGTEQNYCMLDISTGGNKVVGVHDKQYCNSIFAFNGLAFIHDHDAFWASMQSNTHTIRDEIQLSPALFSMAQRGKYHTWFDVGTEEGLLAARQSFDGLQNLDKPDEELYICDDKVIKYFHNPDIVRNRIARQRKMPGVTPTLIETSKNFYSYQFVQGKDLFHVSRPQDHMKALLDFALESLWKPVSFDVRRFQEVCLAFYRDKTYERLKRFYAQTRLVDQEEIVNNIATRQMSEYLALVNWPELAESALPGGFHGDFQLSNVVVDRHNHFTFIDWRQDFGGIIDYGDICYDFAKMNACFVMPHDSVKSGLYSFAEHKGEILVSIQTSAAIEACQKIFFDWLRDKRFPVRKTHLLTYLALLNMAPLHEPPLDRWLYFTAKHGLAQIFRS